MLDGIFGSLAETVHVGALKHLQDAASGLQDRLQTFRLQRHALRPELS